MNTFFIVRHGETEWNISGKTQGQGDSKLTDKGREQAYKLGKKLLDYNIDFIYSSDLGRTKETSQILADILGVKVAYLETLREINFGKWEGLTIDEIKSEYEKIYTIWRNEPHNAIIPDGENLSVLKERIYNEIINLNKKHKSSNILIVSHSMSIKVLLLSLLGSDLSNIYRIKQDNTALNIVQFKDYGPVIVKLNDTGHLQY
ncbi:probable phosphoglycerate mutase [Alkalithermobacter thermoalcaliphilus JW-YL-7 = DSM 7308]|uniref:Phosphoglycerate mutase n=1 Tax=Alkalithermobacter thermoalcaliphilus JW-YL-7 = DSM 7308 TaxID=1121328 RepID=A0A150FQK3_CLOPD|nr:Phosphoglycerate mutase [[Clostridium] paradoxum JW-YL-7 = DSM 7308]SHK78995.1 probable phosphoglycerate mutase [[Clostridium] paradoxum JW-YL-7 = DSM 7308]